VNLGVDPKELTCGANWYPNIAEIGTWEDITAHSTPLVLFSTVLSYKFRKKRESKLRNRNRCDCDGELARI